VGLNATFKLNSQFFGTHQDGYAFIGIAGDQDPIQVRETPEEICALLGIPNDGGKHYMRSGARYSPQRRSETDRIEA
jgi:hypothetical protein